MKKLFYALGFLLMTAACSTTAPVTSTNPGTEPQMEPGPVIPSGTKGTAWGYNTKEMQKKQFQSQEKSNFTPMPTVNQGIGPVNIAASNFYFSGNMQIQNNTPIFYDCAVGANLPIATDKGAYQQVSQAYMKAAATPGAPVHMTFRGYLMDNPGNNSPQSVVITYLSGTSTDTGVCQDGKTLSGSWSASLIGRYQGKADLQLNKDFSFVYKVVSEGNTLEMKGGWMLTSATDVTFFFLEGNNFMGHTASFNPNNMSLFMPTSSGTLIFKK